MPDCMRRQTAENALSEPEGTWVPERDDWLGSDSAGRTGPLGHMSPALGSLWPGHPPLGEGAEKRS